MKQMNGPNADGDKQNYAKWFGFGIEFCGVLGIFCYIGYKLDQRLNTGPWLLLAGFFVGFAGMLYMVLKETLNIRRK
jgi:F0F1-type ATP synthase assembly protein I